MATNAGIGHGSTFKRGDGASPEVFSTVGEVLSISGPGLSRDAIDGTHMESTEKWREFVAGLKDGGEITVEINFDPDGTSTTDALSDINSDSAKNYKITFPDTTDWDFSGFMTSLEPTDPLDDKMTASLTFKLTGKPAFIS